jgi:hypothetical protein
MKGIFGDSLVLYRINDTEILNHILLYLITFLSPFNHFAYAYIQVMFGWQYQTASLKGMALG